MNKRAVSIIGMLVGLVVSVAGGYLIGRPPFGILGAFVLTGGFILFIAAAAWGITFPDMSTEKVLRRTRNLLIVQAALIPLGLAGGAAQLAGDRLPTSFFWVALAIITLFTSRRSLAELRAKLAAEKEAEAQTPEEGTGALSNS